VEMGLFSPRGALAGRFSSPFIKKVLLQGPVTAQNNKLVTCQGPQPAAAK